MLHNLSVQLNSGPGSRQSGHSFLHVSGVSSTHRAVVCVCTSMHSTHSSLPGMKISWLPERGHWTFPQYCQPEREGGGWKKKSQPKESWSSPWEHLWCSWQGNLRLCCLAFFEIILHKCTSPQITFVSMQLREVLSHISQFQSFILGILHPLSKSLYPPTLFTECLEDQWDPHWK